MSEPRTVTARWVFPVAGPPLAGGTVTVRGDRIEAVEPRGTRTPDEDLGNVAVVPGLVNAHTHLDLSGARGLIPPTDPDHFTDWLRGVIAYRRSRTPEQMHEDIREGLAECLRSGTTMIGDIAAEGQSWDALAAASMRAVVYYEMIGLGQERASGSYSGAGGWLERVSHQQNPRPGLGPHAPYSFGFAWMHATARSAERVAMHIAEAPGELELLAKKTGPFVPFLQALGVWEPDKLAPTLYSLLIALTGAKHPLLVHGNYLPPNQLGITQKSVSIVYCPRTHAAFGHPPHPFREFLARRVRVCLGTDSLASNPDLDILTEARFVHQRYPDFPGDALLRMVTLSGAEALGWADEAGSLEPGKSADLVAAPLPDRDADDPHELLFASTGERRTMFRGEWR